MKLATVTCPDPGTGLFVSACPEIGTVSQGKSEGEALANLHEATDLYPGAFPHAPRLTTIIRAFELVRNQAPSDSEN